MILDWYIVMALTGGYVFFTDLFVRLAAAKVYCVKKSRKTNRDSEVSDRRDTRVSVADLMRTDVSETVKPRQSTLIEAGLAVYRTHYNLSEATERQDPADEDRTAFRHALIEFGRAARDCPDVAARYSLDKIARTTSAPYTGDSREKQDDQFDRNQFRSDFIQAARGTGMTNTEAERLSRRIASETKKEAAEERSRATLVEIREAMHAVRPRDMLAVGVICLSWAAYQFVRPWLYWRGLRRGLKPGCDVKLMWFFVPASIYNETFGTWLRVWGIIMFVGGVIYFSYGAYLIATNMFAARRWFSRSRSVSDVESQRGLLRGNATPSQDGSSTASTVTPRSQWTGPLRRKRASKRCRFYFRVVAGFQSVILIVSIVVVEGTLSINNVDMTRGDLRTSSQLMAFVVGVISSVPVFWECLVIAPLRWAILRKKKGHGVGTWYVRRTRIESTTTVPDDVQMTSANVV